MLNVWGTRRFFWFVVNCWENLTSVFFFFFLSPFPCCFLFLCQSCEGIKDVKDKDKDTLKLNFHFWSLRLFCGMEYFSKLIEIAVFPLSRHLKNFIESFLAYCKFEGLPCASVFSGYVPRRLLQAGGTTHC